MVFFDLNVPFIEDGSQSEKDSRLKVVVKAMELGYSGVAYNRSIKGAMSDSDRCTIPLFPLSSLLKLAPSLSSSVRFHRHLLGVPPNTPFRQYTRLTVAVDTPVHAAALNSGNLVLKTYDLIAVRPLNQTSFDQACKVSEVDLIAIDFSQKLQFRLKLPMVKAAIERGIHFEITYSHLISDVHVRRQMLQGAKLLVDWTRGKNLIFTSAALIVNELRGPYDVANLSTLLGLSMERAKAAISRNCRSLVANSIRKKQFYKEAIRVERISPGDDWCSWDPLSSGEGDLSLDDIAKCFSATSKVPKCFSNVFQSLDDTATFFSVADELWPSATTNKVPTHSNGLDEVLVADEIPLACTPSTDQISGCEGDLLLLNDTTNKSYNGLDVVLVAGGMPSDDKPLKGCISGSEGNLFRLDETVTAVTAAKGIKECERSNEFDAVSVLVGPPLFSLPSKDCIPNDEGQMVSMNDTVTFSCASKGSYPFSISNGDLERSYGVYAYDTPMEEVLTESEVQEETDVVSATCNIPLQKDFSKTELLEDGDKSIPIAHDMPLEKTFDVTVQEQGDTVLDAAYMPLEEVAVEVEERKQDGFAAIKGPMHKSKSGMDRFKRRLPHRAFPLPFKGLLKPVALKRKARRLKNKRNMI